MARKYLLDKVRNIGIMAHIDAGKTTVTERMLFLTHKIRKIGETHNGESTMDWMDQEKERGITITSAATTATWNGYKINIIDTPGHVDFTVEVSRSLRVLDGAVTLLDAHTGVQSQTETVWRQANEFNVPRIIFANKMDIIGADFDETLKSIDDRFGVNAKAIQYPIGTADTFVGIIDLLSKKAYKFLNENEDMEEVEIPNDLIDIVNKKREELIESVVIFDDNVMEKYLDKEDISIDEIKLCIRKGVLKNEFFPVLCGTGLGNKGIKFLLDAIVDYLPSPIDVESTKAIDDNGNEFSIKVADDEPFRALAFKVMTDQFVGKLTFFRVYSGTLNKGQTVLNSSKDIKERVGRILLMNANDREDIETVYSGDIAAAVGLKNTTTGNTLCDMKHKCLLESMTFPEPVIELTVEPKSKEDQEKLMIALQKLAEEDPTFKVRSDLETGQTLIAGMGELHLEVIVDRLRREFNVECNIGMPKVSYRETITVPAECEGKYIKQSGGRGQYGHVKIKFEPNPSKGYEFINAIQGGVIPSEYISVIDKGLQEAMEGGMLAGYQVVDVKATLYDGSYHDVDSSEMAYKIAASFALRDAKEKCEPTLLEPIMKVDVEAPNEYLGSIIGDISSRRGKTLGTEMSGKFVKVHSLVPLKEMFGYVTSLRSNTQGRGTYTMLFDHYEQLPSSIVKEVTKQLNA